MEPNLVQQLINASEKAANIARVCRSNETLLKLLVQEKTGPEANARFEHDFKTLADVLIQETIKHDIGELFPAMREAINGEESPNFTNADGESVTIAVSETAEETAQCLGAILNVEAAEVLANEVHREVIYEEALLGEIPTLPEDLDYGNLGIWIDPIDGTAEYISGDSIFTDFPGITSTGLDCVTVLVGVYDRTNGRPVIGVVSQPFHNKLDENLYRSLIFWGVCLPDLQANNCQFERPARDNRLGIFSSSENGDILQRIMELGYEFAFAAGAGHKALKVITWEVDLYLLSKGSTFKWDTCAPQAILRSLGGDIYSYRGSISECKPIPLCYREVSEEVENPKCNKDGLIAVRDVGLLEDLLQKLTV
ncbi:PREDICTED: inositol polyphosphate 1-phosphatase [Bactrocera latifrons]|uniref:inositol-1,4-bisphosphate 1-phosphatase n=1 Tax=Bactrocera latifrons TaxID=174628 RepID=A0A0K8UH91_BACLA|nr:PREDICTED: inositol polyphosphate 1-phosphatase [Bactrocera latifrons]